MIIATLMSAYLLGRGVFVMPQQGRSPDRNGPLWGSISAGLFNGEIFFSKPVTPTLTIALQDLPAWDRKIELMREVNPRGNQTGNIYAGSGGIAGGLDPLLSLQSRAPQAVQDGFSTPILNFDGQGYSFVNPPDTVGDVGPNHYVQMINGSGGALIKVFDKSGNNISAPLAIESFVSSGACRDGAGDPIVLYDQLADRWLLSEFSSTQNYLCIYVSQTADPTGSYYAYAFQADNFPDYPKYGVWQDAYYVTSNESLPAVYALDRGKMLMGQAATLQRFTAPAISGFGFQALTPADLDGAIAPPAGAPGYMMRHVDDEAHSRGSNDPAKDFLEIWAFDVDFEMPANSSFSLLATIETAEFDSDLCGYITFNCIPQPGTSVMLDPIREIIMHRLVYRNFGNIQVLLGNFVTDVNGSDHGGVRWFELRKAGLGNWNLYQEGTYAPDTTNRWMGSLAMDGSGNIALGYNVSSSNVYPGLRYTGRKAADPSGTLPQGEYVVQTGSASNSINRYGDYSSLSVDPADDCTFWFTGEYNGASTWSTRVSTFKFDSCGEPPDVQVSHVLLQSVQLLDSVVTLDLAIANIGAGGLVNWSLDEDHARSPDPLDIKYPGLEPPDIPLDNASLSYAESDGNRVSVHSKRGSELAQQTLTQSSDPTTIHSNNSVSCNAWGIHLDNSYLRVFDLAGDYGLLSGFKVGAVEIGIQTAASGDGLGQPLTVNLYEWDGAVGLTYANLVPGLVGTTTINVPDQQMALYSIPVNGDISPNNMLVVEIFSPNGIPKSNSFFIGSNNLGQSAPTYLTAPDCGYAEPTDLASIGFPEMHIVMTVIEKSRCLTPEDTPWLSVGKSSGAVFSGQTDPVEVTLDSTGLSKGFYEAAICIASDDPDEPLVVIPVEMDVVDAFKIFLPVVQKQP